MSENKPPMESQMQIVHLELKKKAPSLLGIMEQPKYDIFHATCYPLSLLAGHEKGWKKLAELHLEEHADKIAEEYGENMETFKTVIPMTRHTVELNQYEPGDQIKIMIYNMKDEVRVV